MKKELNLDEIYLNPTHFHNPVSQQTFDSLPKIYGTIKHRIYSNKLKFYQMIDKNFKRKRNQNSEQRGLGKKRQNQKVRTQKSESKADIASMNEFQVSAEKQKLAKQTNKQLIKRRRLKEQVEQARVLDIKKKVKSEQESKHKVKFNTIRLHPVISYSSAKNGERPQALTEHMDDRIAKNVNLNTPLVHLYKKKSKKHIFNSNQWYIREETLEEEESYPNSPRNRYIPKQLLKNTKLSKQEQQQNLTQNLQNKVKLDRNSPDSLSEKKKNGYKTQISRKIAQTSFQKMSKNIHIEQNKKFKIPTKDQYKQFLKNYSPATPNINFQKLLVKQNFQIITSQKSVYFGQYDHEMHGFGILITPQFVFEGHFQKGQMLSGSQMNYDGIYTGLYSNNLREGQGRFQWNNGQIYEGEWKAGRKDGFGIWRSYNGDSYQGQWNNGRQQGIGTKKHKNNIYKGELLNSLKHGRGEEYFQNGDHYRGSYQLGKPHGFGRYDWRDGSYYEGEFVSGYREGKGQLHETNGSSYKVKALSGQILSMGWVNRFKNQAIEQQECLKTANCLFGTAQHYDLPYNINNIYSFSQFKEQFIQIISDAYTRRLLSSARELGRITNYLSPRFLPFQPIRQFQAASFDCEGAKMTSLSSPA